MKSVFDVYLDGPCVYPHPQSSLQSCCPLNLVRFPWSGNKLALQQIHYTHFDSLMQRGLRGPLSASSGRDSSGTQPVNLCLRFAGLKSCKLKPGV